MTNTARTLFLFEQAFHLGDPCDFSRRITKEQELVQNRNWSKSKQYGCRGRANAGRYNQGIPRISWVFKHFKEL